MPSPIGPHTRLCGAKTRSGKPCQNRAMKNGKCRLHGGRSTGPKRRRIRSVDAIGPDGNSIKLKVSKRGRIDVPKGWVLDADGRNCFVFRKLPPELAFLADCFRLSVVIKSTQTSKTQTPPD